MYIYIYIYWKLRDLPPLHSSAFLPFLLGFSIRRAETERIRIETSFIH